MSCVENLKQTDLSIVIPTFNEAANISTLIDKIREVFTATDFKYEIIVVDANSKDNTSGVASGRGAKVIIQKRPGYGGAISDGIKSALGKYIITMDADFSHNPYILKNLYSHRKEAHIVIASRYVKGGLADMPISRKVLSIILNRFLCLGLSLPLKDVSSGFRLYNAAVFKEIDFCEKNFNVLTEIIVKAYMNGFSVKEIPFNYQPRLKGSSHAKIFSFGIDFLRTFFKMWKIRNTIFAADYDDRAYYSKIPLQRYWQRARYKIIYSLTGSQVGRRVLDAGCGSSNVLKAFPQAVGLDINFKKLRYNVSYGNILVNSDVRNTCFKDASFDLVICSEVIEHLPEGENIFIELKRVLNDGGVLILGTPDYSRVAWRVIEWFYKKIIPGGYADEHISRYKRKELIKKMERLGFKLESYKYIAGSELICKFRKIA